MSERFKDRFEYVELVGGSHDGQRIRWRYPLPPEIQLPVIVTASARWIDAPEPLGAPREIERYQRRNGPGAMRRYVLVKKSSPNPK